MPDLAVVHHVKIPGSDLPRSVRWYREVFGFRPTMQFADSGDGDVRGAAGDIPGLGMVALRETLTSESPWSRCRIGRFARARRRAGSRCSNGVRTLVAGAPSRIRTDTEWILSPLPLPIGL